MYPPGTRRGSGGSSSGDLGKKSSNKRARPTTLIACNECRKARAKCDGVNPESCSRCSGRGAACVYEPHTKVQKNELIRELQASRAREESILSENHDFSTIFEIIAKHDDVGDIVDRLQKGEPISSIIYWLKHSDQFSAYFRTGGHDLSSAGGSNSGSGGGGGGSSDAQSAEHSMSVSNVLN